MIDHQIPRKTNRVLNLILLAFILILIRVWYLSVAQHEEHLQKARKPQRRAIIEQVERATIRDRFNIPLALNKIEYNAAICYADIRQIPSVEWKLDEAGKWKRVQSRVAYIVELSKALGKELAMDPVQIEDLIHGKASLFPHTPFVIKENISEKQYCRLRMLEKEWFGIQTQMSTRRYYPQGRVGADVVGYLGTMSQGEYRRIAQEMNELQNYISLRESGEVAALPAGFDSPLQVRERLKELEEKSYTINSFIGKAGVEAAFDKTLRGSYGKRLYEVDMKGNSLRELPGSREPMSGQRLLLTMSAELQEYAEMLLAQNELGKNEATKPWIKGGAIVALVPKTGEVLALASYPRFDPNDFAFQRSSVVKWLENDNFIGEVWDGKRSLEKECYSQAKGGFYEVSQELTWQSYIDEILPAKGALRSALEKIVDVRTAFHFQKVMEELLQLSKQKEMGALLQTLYNDSSHKSRSAAPQEKKKEIRDALNSQLEAFLPLKKECDFFLSSITYHEDQLLLIDLCRMLVKTEDCTESLLQAVGPLNLATYRIHGQAVGSMQSRIRKEVQKFYRDSDFARWRETEFKQHLKERRKEEKEQRHYARPYTEYLERAEKQMFKTFWQTHRWLFLDAFLVGEIRFSLPDAHPLKPYFVKLLALRREIALSNPKIEALRSFLLKCNPSVAQHYLKMLRPFEELTRPLLGRYPALRSTSGQQLEKHLAAAFYPKGGYGYGRSQAFRQSTPQGSVFKLVTSYEALKQRYLTLEEEKNPNGNLNPLTLIDDMRVGSSPKGQILGRFTNGQTIYRNYKGGQLPRKHPGIGEIDLTGALEQSSNLYFSILAGDVLHMPSDLSNAARLFGFGERSGIDLPGEIAGHVPEDISHNRTGLYAFAIGQHSLVVTPLQSALMLASIANGGYLLKPKIIQMTAGRESSHDNASLFTASHFPFQEELASVGLHFPLFTEARSGEEKTAVSPAPTLIRRSLFFPSAIRNFLLHGMQQVVTGPKGNARPNVVRGLYDNPKALRDYIDLQNQIVAKTGTAEILYKSTIDAATPAEMKKHIWFAAISFGSPPNKTKFEDLWPEPEMVVIVYLRFGGAGKQAAPIAAQIIKKWREICAKHGRSSLL